MVYIDKQKHFCVDHGMAWTGSGKNCWFDIKTEQRGQFVVVRESDRWHSHAHVCTEHCQRVQF